MSTQSRKCKETGLEYIGSAAKLQAKSKRPS